MASLIAPPMFDNAILTSCSEMLYHYDKYSQIIHAFNKCQTPTHLKTQGKTVPHNKLFKHAKSSKSYVTLFIIVKEWETS